MTVADAARVRALAAAGKSPSAIEIETGVGIRTIHAILGRAPSPQEVAEVDRLTGWSPLCMDADDWRHWQRTNPRFAGDGGFAPRPCTDCPAGFAAEMRGEGKCNGTPGWRPPADDHEEAAVGDTITASRVTVSAPCETCVHRDVCAIRRTLGDLEEVELTMPKPDPALTVGLSVTVECSHYLRDKGPKRVSSPAQLAAMGANLAKARERKAAKAAERASA